MTGKSSSKTRVLLGTIAAAHGIKGEVLLRTYTAAAEAIADYGPLSDAEGKRTFRLKSARPSNRGIIARIEGINDRNAAEALRGTDLFVSRTALPDTAAGEYYYNDLIGLDACDPSGATIGSVVAVSNFGAGDLLEVRFKDRKATEYVPFTDACVPIVDVPGGFVTVVMPDMVGDPEPQSGEQDEEQEGDGEGGAG